MANARLRNVLRSVWHLDACVSETEGRSQYEIEVAVSKPDGLLLLRPHRRQRYRIPVGSEVAVTAENAARS
jgi:hypothetical protein